MSRLLSRQFHDVYTCEVQSDRKKQVRVVFRVWSEMVDEHSELHSHSHAVAISLLHVTKNQRTDRLEVVSASK